MEYVHVSHPFPPLWREDSRILILGSFPSVRSREQKFFYGHPQNRFWKVMAALLDAPVPVTVEEKRGLLLDHGIALWDVIASCDIAGSSDQSIRNAVPNDLGMIMEGAQIRQIFANGALAGRLYEKHQAPVLGRGIEVLPSTSPANAAWTLDRLTDRWRVILNCPEAGS